MTIPPEVRSQIEEIAKRAGYLWRYLDVEKKQERIAELENTMGAPGFWDSQEKAQAVIGESNRLKTSIESIIPFSARVDDLKAMAELVEEADEEEGEEYLAEVTSTATTMLEELDKLEIQSFLSGKMDHCNAILSIHAGAGGTESCDWANMLLRQYTRWAERSGYTIEMLDIQAGEEAGISSAEMRIMGPNAYGYAKAERGVHRLVRISPFDSNKRRHTSFCSVDVVAELEDDIEVDINPEDLRVDTYRASGAGGQHVNKTESAIRITHVPTNIVVQCQNDRSQHKNRATAMKQLKSKLYEYEQDKKKAEMERFYGEKGEIGWGNQIRSYVFQPYQMVKDLRTGVETGNVQAVQDGDLDAFIHGWLRAGSPTSRNKEINLDD
ncbi:peptide chain release factor 2 [Rubellicoccus peritrichatus]|uniref:Peptide chain release factor 2 n=1 Tax=Rubellicoccus peritrichatus TaxID=3080537 RepID=A0AAQ3LAD1_9BACT|nr:peptide chain release factor 2 [Puniceicoccus sp. CR14]WOO42554.1 peptide chain release factor 2 [Puniceicoccus sp. CR14]